ncbi:hypothetical protein [Sphingopyxis granuli]|uniref:hypothetical protein n=1 Tax=Sphingopyxis granuli TaxID=267128 RepID=UPI001BB03DE2|nr:hypothetical protein [Sphingopyxis granuli]QUM72204.1 hypothetical protein ICN83_18235 [Sphingopyxis granuli]
MENSIYRSHLRPDREHLEFQSLPLLESSIDRRRREQRRRVERAFAGGVLSAILALTAMAVLF